MSMFLLFLGFLGTYGGELWQDAWDSGTTTIIPWQNTEKLSDISGSWKVSYKETRRVSDTFAQQLLGESIEMYRFAFYDPNFQFNDHFTHQYQCTFTRIRDDGSNEAGSGYNYMYFFFGANYRNDIHPDHFKVQLQYTERYSTEQEHLTKVDEFLGGYSNGAWEHFLEWRSRSHNSDGSVTKSNYLYKQSNYDHLGRSRWNGVVMNWGDNSWHELPWWEVTSFVPNNWGWSGWVYQRTSKYGDVYPAFSPAWDRYFGGVGNIPAIWTNEEDWSNKVSSAASAPINLEKASEPTANIILSENEIIHIGVFIVVVLTVIVLLMCYFYGCKKNKNGYDIVKFMDSDDTDAEI